MRKPQTTSTALQLFIALRGIAVSSAFIYLWYWLATLVRRFDPSLPPLPAQLEPVGGVLAGLGGVLILSCVTTFIFRGKGTPAPFDPPRRFVATGPYRYVRNPMYLGAISVLLGAALLLQSTAIALLAMLFWLLTHVLVIFYEEPALEQRFGEAYLDYKTAVRRWLPHL